MQAQQEMQAVLIPSLRALEALAEHCRREGDKLQLGRRQRSGLRRVFVWHGGTRQPTTAMVTDSISAKWRQ